MKLSFLPTTLCAFALIAAVSPAQAQVSPFRVRVEQVNKSDNEKFNKTQTRSLKIFVSNSSKEAAELIAKYVFFGREIKGNEVVKIDEGEKAVSVKPLGTEMVETGSATTKMEEAHSASTGKGKGGGGNSSGKGNSPGKKVEASGHKFVGYGVQVYQGDKLVAESYDPLSGKEEWTKAYPVKLPTAAPAAKKK